MNTKSASYLLIAGLLVGALAGCASDRYDSSARSQTVGERVDDGWITTKIKSEFVLDNLVSVAAIHVNTDNGVVHLSGVAKDQAEANRAVDIARRVKGVRSVRNDIQIEGVGATR